MTGRTLRVSVLFGYFAISVKQILKYDKCGKRIGIFKMDIMSGKISLVTSNSKTRHEWIFYSLNRYCDYL